MTVQAQILQLLRQLKQAQPHSAVILVTHDMGVIAENADRVAVMYKGRMMGIYENGSRSAAQIGLLMAGISEEQEGAQA